MRTRSRSGRFVRRSRARRRHRNPVAKRSKHHSPAMRAKIGRAVRAAMRGRKSSGGSRRSVRRSSARRRSSRRSIIRVAPMAVTRRRRSYRPKAIRRRRSGSRRGFSFGGGGIGIKSLFDKQTLMVAGGAVGGQFLTRFVLGKFGGSLPMLRNGDGTVNQYGLIGYQLIIPLAGAFVVKRFNPTLAKGLLLGGVISAINSGLNLVQGLALAPSATSGTGEYLDARGVNALPPGYAAVDQFSSAMNPSPAFTGDAWDK